MPLNLNYFTTSPKRHPNLSRNCKMMRFNNLCEQKKRFWLISAFFYLLYIYIYIIFFGGYPRPGPAPLPSPLPRQELELPSQSETLKDSESRDRTQIQTHRLKGSSAKTSRARVFKGSKSKIQYQTRLKLRLEGSDFVLLTCQVGGFCNMSNQVTAITHPDGCHFGIRNPSQMHGDS